MSSIYLIDGYNVVYAVARLRKLVHEQFETARDALCDLVSAFCTASGHSAKIIFDGRGRTHDASTPPLAGKRVEIIYGPLHLTADTVIERMVYKARDPKALIVVTGDRGIRDICQHMGSFVMTPEIFLATAHEAQNSLRETMGRPSDRKPNLLEDRLDQDTLDRLSALKKQL